jgi:hypothetical protein
MPGNGQFTKGPLLHYVCIPAYNNSQAFFLGTHVTSPKERQESYEIPVYNDLGGRSARFQSINDREEWRIPTTLNRFDYNIVRALRYLKSGAVFTGFGFPNPLDFPLTGLAIPLGTQSNISHGTLIMGSQDFQLFLINSYANTAGAGLPTVAAEDLHLMRGYASCSITAYEEEQEENRVTSVAMMIEARGLFNPSISPATIGNVVNTPARGFANYLEVYDYPSQITFSALN